MSLLKIRKKIDDIDRDILKKMNKRMELALETRRFKRQISVCNRESQVIEKIKKHAMNLPLIESDFAEKIFYEFIKESRRLQCKEKR